MYSTEKMDCLISLSDFKAEALDKSFNMPWFVEFPDYGNYSRKPSSYANYNLFQYYKLILAHTIIRDVFLNPTLNPI